MKAYALSDGAFREYQLRPLDPDRGFKGGFVIDEHDAKTGGRIGRVHLDHEIADTLAFVLRDIAELQT